MILRELGEGFSSGAGMPESRPDHAGGDAGSLQQRTSPAHASLDAVRPTAFIGEPCDRKSVGRRDLGIVSQWFRVGR
jgi:hypothetical protein